MTFISSVLIFFVHLIQSLTDVFFNNSDQLIWKFISGIIGKFPMETTGEAPARSGNFRGVRYLSFQKSIFARKAPQS